MDNFISTIKEYACTYAFARRFSIADSFLQTQLFQALTPLTYSIQVEDTGGNGFSEVVHVAQPNQNPVC
jgi:hypothetical protein